MNKKIILFLVIFSVGIIFTYPAFPTSHALDSYCTICNGYNETALSLLKNGRLFSGVSYYLFNILNIPFNSLGFISAFLSVFFLTIATLKLYELVKKNIGSNSYIFNALLLICVFLIYFNPLFTSVILLDEAFIICLGILFLTLASVYLFKKTKFNYIISLIFSILGIMCYPGIVSYMFVTLFIIFISSKKYRYDFQFILKKIGLTIINYIIGFISSFFINRLVCNILGKDLVINSNFNIVDNIKQVFSELLPNSLDLFNYVNIKYFYTLIIVLFIITTIYIFKNNNKTKNLFLILLVSFCAVLMPFISYAFTNFSNNDLNATMILTVGSLPSIIILYILSIFPIKNRMIYCLSSLSLLLFLLTFFSIHQDMMTDLKRYKTDVKYINDIIEKINYHEDKNHIKINKIYYAFDTNVARYYSFGNNNDTSIRIVSMPKNLECAFNAISNNEYKFNRMNNKDYLKYFKNKNYDELSDEQFILNGKNLYILIY